MKFPFVGTVMLFLHGFLAQQVDEGVGDCVTDAAMESNVLIQKEIVAAFGPFYQNVNPLRPEYSACTCLSASVARHSVVDSFLSSSAQSTPRRVQVAVTTAVNYADKLAVSLGCNRNFFTEYHVIHSPGDRIAVQALCNHFNASCHETKAFQQPAGSKFNKGRALAELQERLHRDPRHAGALIVLVDADICLPSNFLSVLPSKFAPGTLYYTPGRYIYRNPESLKRGAPDSVQHSIWALGFFQAYVAPLNFTYPIVFPGAAKSDLSFARKFPHRKALETLRVHMLGSPGHDWFGRNGEQEPWTSAAGAHFIPPTAVCKGCDIYFGVDGNLTEVGPPFWDHAKP